MLSAKVSTKISNTKLIPDSWHRIKSFLYDDEFAKMTTTNKVIYHVWKKDKRFAPNGNASDKVLLDMFKKSKALFKIHDLRMGNVHENKKEDKFDTISEQEAKIIYLSEMNQIEIFDVISSLLHLEKNENFTSDVILILEHYMFMYQNFHMSYNTLSPIKLFKDFIGYNKYIMIMLDVMRATYPNDYYNLLPDILYNSIDKYNQELAQKVLSEIGNFRYPSNTKIYNKALIIATSYSGELTEYQDLTRKEIINSLVQARADVKLCDQQKSLIYDPIERSLVDITELLLINGADPNYKIENHLSLLGLAIRRTCNDTEDPRFKIIKLLIQFGAKLDNIVLESAVSCQRHKTFVIELLFNDKSLDPNIHDTEGHPMIILASENRNGLKLLEYGANPFVCGKNGETPLLRAAAYSNTPMLNKLLSGEYKIDVNEKNNAGETALMVAVTRSRWGCEPDTIDRLLAAGARIDILTLANTFTLFEHALANDVCLPLISIFLDSKININLSDQNGNTLSMKAVQHDAFQIADYLVTRKANVNIKSHEGRTVLDYAIDKIYGNVFSKYNVQRLLFTLLEAGAEIEIDSMILLLKEAMTTSLYLYDLDKLLKYSAIRKFINMYDGAGETALLAYLRNRQWEGIKPLLEAKADPNLASEKGLSPLNYALKYANYLEHCTKNVIDPLLEHGANPHAKNAWFASTSNIFEMRDPKNADDQTMLTVFSMFSKFRSSDNNSSLGLRILI